jgi:biotin transport system substrate-specific component
MTVTTLSASFRPYSRSLARLYDAATVLGASILIGLSAQVAILLPWSPVPITLQTLAVLLTGAALGAKRGAAAVALVLVEGAAGLPVFSGWTGGLAHLLGPTGGYLIGFVVAAFLSGWLAERGWDRRPATSVAAMVLGNAAIYAVGLVWLAAFVGWTRVLPLGLVPFLAGDALKIAVATGLLPLTWRLVRR